MSTHCDIYIAWLQQRPWDILQDVVAELYRQLKGSGRSMPSPSVRAGSAAHFSLKVTPGSPHELDMWRAAVSPMFEIGPLSAEESAAFAMDTTGYFLPGMAISRTTSSACTFERSRDVIARSGIESILVQVYVDGGYRLDTEGTHSRIMPGDIVAFDLTRPCKIYAESYSNIALTLPSEMIAPMIVDMAKLHGLILRNGEPLNILLRSHLQMMHSEAANLGAVEQSAIVQGTAALLAACLGPSLAAREGVVSNDATPTLQLIRRAIDGRLDDLQLDPESLARQFGLSRASIYRLFEPLGGVRAYIQQRRLMHAYHLITNPAYFEQPIGEIAKRMGFTKNTAFSRAFRSLYKMTPSDVRAAARSGYLSSHHAPQSGEASAWMINRWLLGLDASGKIDDRARKEY